MLQSVSISVRQCHEHAARCHRKAVELDNAEAQQAFFDMEQRWLDLAHSFEFSERLTRFCNAARRK